MKEIELKIELDAAQERRVRRTISTCGLSVSPAKVEQLWSIYYDTAAHDLRARGIALRLRKRGAQWVQTVKIASDPIENGLSAPVEIEYPVAGKALDLTRLSDHDLREDLIGFQRQGLEPVAETRFQRTIRLATDGNGTRVEVCVDKGTVGSNGSTQPLLELELELLTGNPKALYDMAALLLPNGPVRFSTVSKSMRALRVADDAAPAPLRKARRLDLSDSANVGAAARRIIAEGAAHAVPNMARVVDLDDEGGPHQLRVGLRRLRSALSAFRRCLTDDAFAQLGADAQWIGAEAGRLRDLDVLCGEIIQPSIEGNREAAGLTALHDTLTAEREKVRASVRRALSGKRAAGFAFTLGRVVVDDVPWQATDAPGSKTLSSPVLPFTQTVLRKRWRGVERWGKQIDTLSIEERHEMRKALKKLRYMADAFRSLYDPEAVEIFMQHVKKLQKAFGALNDFAMVELMLTGPRAPLPDEPAAQRAIGQLLGRLEARSDHLWPDAVAGWKEMAALDPFWR